MIPVNIFFYAQLRDYFGESISLQVPADTTALSVLDMLKERNSLAADWLKVSRVASEDAFLDGAEKVIAGGRYYILPPSSGG